MHYAITIKYIYKNIFFFFLFSENLFKNSIILFLPSFSIFYIILFFKYSYFFKNFILLDLGAYEIPSLSSNNDLLYKNIIYYIFKNTIDTYIFIFSILKDYSIISVEYLFRNAK
jgi:hypothetical protein